MAEFLFVLKKIFAQLVMPPTGLLLLAIIALLLLRRWPRTSRTVLWLCVLTLLALSTPFVADALVKAVSPPSATSAQQQRAQAIVVLGSGREHFADVGEVPTQPSYERVRYGAQIARMTHLPVLISGGIVFQGQPEAQTMGRVMREQFQIEPRWIEDRSRNTHENALYSVAMLKAANVRSILLVTHDIHERRSLAEFRAAGIEAVPMGASSVTDETRSFAEKLPRAKALLRSADAIHEILGSMLAP